MKQNFRLYTEVREPCCYHLTNAILKDRQKYKNILSLSVRELVVGSLCHLSLISTYSLVLILFLSHSVTLSDLNTGGGGREREKHKMIESDKLTEREGGVRIEEGGAL